MPPRSRLADLICDDMQTVNPGFGPADTHIVGGQPGGATIKKLLARSQCSFVRALQAGFDLASGRRSISELRACSNVASRRHPAPDRMSGNSTSTPATSPAYWGAAAGAAGISALSQLGAELVGGMAAVAQPEAASDAVAAVDASGQSADAAMGGDGSAPVQARTLLLMSHCLGPPVTSWASVLD